jgi:hypothetical protein
MYRLSKQWQKILTTTLISAVDFAMWNNIARRDNTSPGFNGACWYQLPTNCGNFRDPQLKLVEIDGWEADDV